MKNKNNLIYTLISIILFFQSNHVFSQISSCKKCDLNVVNYTNNNLMKLTRDRINCFLLGFNKSCKNNVEYSEYSNEVLFKLIFNYPKEVIDILSKDANIDKTYIYDELSHPLLDNPSINDIIKKIKNVNTANVTKKELINALTKATLELDY